jgi:hypothetical protein
VGGAPGLGIVEGLQHHIMPGRPGGCETAAAPQQPGPADLSRASSRPCARPFLISNIMGLEDEEEERREEEEEEEAASPPAGRHHHHLEEEGGVSPGTSPGPDSGSEMGMGDEDSIAKVGESLSYLRKSTVYCKACGLL